MAAGSRVGRATQRAQAVTMVALVGTYPPRECGIATYGASLRAALVHAIPDLAIPVVACTDTGQHYGYPECVRCALEEDDVASYRRAAADLNASEADVVCLQHEYGIFSGERGRDVLTLLRSLRKPVVTTFHTILSDPYPDQLEIVSELAERSSMVVAMSHMGAEFLHSIYGVAEDKIVFIPHGAPDVPFVEPDEYKSHLGFGNRAVLMTVGLIRPKKGIEYVISALPTLVTRYPEVLYLVVGATWSPVRRREGEAYRRGLERMARDLGVERNVMFLDEFVAEERLLELLLSADVYIASYLSPLQSSSGTLALALAAGKAVVATPFFYAQEMLAGGRGVLVPFGNADSIATCVGELLGNDPARRKMRQKAYAFGRSMRWRYVSRQYLHTFVAARS